ncbi:hypothetical protein GCM10010420_37580 [Streptomyces glaucosporus]|uniref:DUF5709 domain-containing protein n=1 Tax=Streptomyces glaucosporus TaxID=284044 RepID=A0ABN3IKS1_9ACTN
MADRTPDENEPTGADDSRPELTEEGGTATDDENPGLPPDDAPATGPSPGDSVLDGPDDPGGNPEDEGIPDLQNGTPEQQWMNDPQQMPVPGERAVAADRWGTTYAEQVEGESLDQRLAQEEPEVREDASAGYGPPADRTGQLSYDPLDDRPANQDVFSHESPVEGMSPEESAVHTVDDDRDIGQLRGENDEDQTGAPEGVGEVGPSGEGEGTGVHPDRGGTRNR